VAFALCAFCIALDIIRLGIDCVRFALQRCIIDSA
jgi:hypothetical protein